MRDIRVIHLTHSVGPGSTGVGTVVPGLALAQRDVGLDAGIWCTARPGDIDWAAQEVGMPPGAFRGFGVVGPRRLAHSPGMLRSARSTEGRLFEVVHQHGIWTGVSRVTRAFRFRHGTPTVIAAHGSLARWALRRGRLQKWLAGRAYERRNLLKADCLHAVTFAEALDYRAFGLANPVAVIPNGVSDHWLDSVGDGDRFRKAFGVPRQARAVLFVGRVSPEKGLLSVVRALAGQRASLAGWVLVVAGPDARGHQAVVESLARAFDLGEQLRFVGPLYGQAKRDAFSAAELFLLPSSGEAAPLVVPEALGAGVPVLTTTATPWEDLVRHGAGWWVEPSPEAIGEAWREAASLDAEVLRAMGARGRELVRASYRWTRSAEMTIALYEWLRGRRERPDFVVTD